MNLTRIFEISESLEAHRSKLDDINTGLNAGHKNMLHLIQLRWLAVIGQITTISIVMLGFQIALPLAELLQVLVLLIAFNVVSHLRWHESRAQSNNALFLALLVDVSALTALLFFSGGITNPFAFLYLLQISLAAVLLNARSTWAIVAITSICLACLSFYARPLTLPVDNINGLSTLYIEGLLLCFALNAGLLVFFITRISRNLSTGAAQLADLRQHTAEEAHIVRMGLLASGAAHELGTPLATLAVILGDWRRMPEFSRNPQLLSELEEMQAQLKRCKTIVSGVLLSAGEARSETAVKTTICTFLDTLMAEWRTTRPIGAVEYNNRITQDIDVVFDSALRQMLCNVLDNAVEASPNWLRLEALIEDQQLKIAVLDAGNGFQVPMLAHFGKPYQSSKGRLGGGLGLFFSVNLVRKLGGNIEARNLDGGGAVVRIALPLSAISLRTEHSDA